MTTDLWLPSGFTRSGTLTSVRANPAEALGEPFYDEAIRRLVTGGAPVTSQPLSDVPAAGPAPILVLWHTGRCGSTLLGRMLGTDPSLLVVREAAVLGEAQLRALAALSEGRLDSPAVDDLCRVITALATAAASAERRLVLKMSSWQAVHLPALIRMLPSCHHVLLHRSAEAVVASSLRVPPAWAVKLGEPADERARFIPWRATGGPSDDRLTGAELFAAMWASIVSAALTVAIPTIAYDELVDRPLGVAADLCRAAGVTGSLPDAARGITTVDAKDPAGRRFDPNASRPDLPRTIAALVRAMVGDLPDRLARSTPPVAGGHGPNPASEVP